MKIILAAITFLFYAAQLKAAEQIYVVTISNAKAALSDGTEFNMEKGDTYPFVSYDQSQTLAQLKLGPLTFWARTNNLKLVPEVEVPDASRKYEADVKQFFAKREAAQPAGGRGVNMQLITAEAVKAYWLKGIVEPARMSADEYKIKAANESKRNGTSGFRVG